MNSTIDKDLLMDPTGRIYQCVLYLGKSKTIVLNYDENCQIDQIVTFVGEKLNGDYLCIKNGKIRRHYVYEDDRLMDVISIYDSNGNNLYYSNIKRGTGHLKEYDINGNSSQWGNYIEGKKEGYWYIRSNTGHTDSVLYINNIMQINQIQ